MDGLLSLSLSGKEVILGYGNQQSLIYAASGVEGLASGNFRNVRSFDPQNFDVPENETIIQRATWYYDANTLSEYRAESLKLAYQRGLSGNFGPICDYCRPLLQAPNPAAVPCGEPMAFRHYLTEIHRQWLAFNEESPNDRINKVVQILENAQEHLNSLVERGFRPGERSFLPVFDPTLSALVAFYSDRRKEIDLLG